MGTEKNHREKERERERDARVHAPKKESHQKRFSKAPRDKSDSHLLSSTTFDAFPRTKDPRSSIVCIVVVEIAVERENKTRRRTLLFERLLHI